MRVSIEATVSPMIRVSGPASEERDQAEREVRADAQQDDAAAGDVFVLGEEEHDRGDGAGAGDERDGEREDGDVVLRAGVLGLLGGDFLGALLAPLGALLEQHVDGDQEEQQAAGDAEGVDARRGSAPTATRRRRRTPSRMPVAMAIDLNAIVPPPLRASCALVMVVNIGAIADRIDGDEEGDERGEQQRKHQCGLTDSAACLR